MKKERIIELELPEAPGDRAVALVALIFVLTEVIGLGIFMPIWMLLN